LVIILVVKIGIVFMEGFVKVSTRGKYYSAYVILEGQYLYYYQSFDEQTRELIKPQGTQCVRGCRIDKGMDGNVANWCVSMVYTSDYAATIFDCGSEYTQSLWFKALCRAGQEHEERHELENRMLRLRRLLGVSPHEKLDGRRLNMLFRFRIKQLEGLGHRDGSAQSLALQEAFDALMAIYTDTHMRKTHRLVDFEAEVRKPAAGGGLGISVREDHLFRRIVVDEVSPSASIVGLSFEAHGSIQPEDVLIAIDGDDCSDWPLTRVRARLDPPRLLPGATVRLSFERLSLPEQGSLAISSSHRKTDVAELISAATPAPPLPIYDSSSSSPAARSVRFSTSPSQGIQ
jgi:hypothetical protein